jgi:hypothetical protein
LSTFLRDIHAEHIRAVRLYWHSSYVFLDSKVRQRITRYMVVIWQAAIPPLVCALALLIKYIAFTLAHPVRGSSEPRSSRVSYLLRHA